MRTRQRPGKQPAIVTPSGRHGRARDRVGTSARAIRSTTAPLGGALVALAALGAFVGVAGATSSAGAIALGTARSFRLTQSARSSLPKHVSPSTVEAVVKHPCTLLTEPEADAAAGVRFSQQFDLAATGLCEYVAASSSSSTINVYVQPGTVTQDLPPKAFNRFDPQPALGTGVVWVVEKGAPKGSGELWFPLGKAGKGTYSVQVEIGRGGLSEVSTIARDCFSHL